MAAYIIPLLLSTKLSALQVFLTLTTYSSYNYITLFALVKLSYVLSQPNTL